MSGRWWTLDPPRASGGSRTRNPRITNAVLCQLKLRWRRLAAALKRASQVPGESRGPASSPTLKISAEWRLPSSRSQKPAVRMTSRAQSGGSSGIFAGHIEWGRGCPCHLAERSGRRKLGGGAPDPAGASCHGSAGQGQGDRTPGVSQRPHLMYGYWRAVGTVRRGSIEMQMACQSWQRRRLLTRWGTGEGAGRAFGCFFQPSARQTQPPLALPLGPTDTRGGAIDRPLL